MKSLAYYQGTADPKEKRVPDKLPGNRVDLDTRHPHIYTWYKNFDYTADPAPNSTGIGGSLYHGPMDRFQSVKQFLDYRRKIMKERSDKVSSRTDIFIKLASMVVEE